MKRMIRRIGGGTDSTLTVIRHTEKIDLAIIPAESR